MIRPLVKTEETASVRYIGTSCLSHWILLLLMLIEDCLACKNAITDLFGDWMNLYSMIPPYMSALAAKVQELLSFGALWMAFLLNSFDNTIN